MRRSPQDRVELANGAPDRRAQSRGAGQTRTVPVPRTDAHAPPLPHCARQIANPALSAVRTSEAFSAPRGRVTLSSRGASALSPHGKAALSAEYHTGGRLSDAHGAGAM